MVSARAPSVPSQEIRVLLGARKQMQIKVIDLEQTVCGLLRDFGLKVGDVSWGLVAAPPAGSR